MARAGMKTWFDARWATARRWLTAAWTTATRWYYRSTLLPHRKFLSFLLGFIAACLPLATRLMSEQGVTYLFLVAVIILLLVLLVIRPNPFTDLPFDHSRWAMFSIFVLGYGLGTLIYHYRKWLIWLWYKFREIDKPEEWILVSLFLLGVMLGFFVVRNWSKEQKDFISSLTAVFGAAFLSGLLGVMAPVISQSSVARPTATPTPGTSPSPAVSPAAPAGSPATATPSPTTTPAARTATTTTTTTPPPPAATAAPAPSPATAASPAIAAGSPATTTESQTPSLNLNPVTTFAFYALGFALSGTLNLIAFALLISHYSRTQSSTSRAIIDFLYGSDKAEAIDNRFLKNFEQDPNYARVMLINALNAYRQIIKTEFAQRMTDRKTQTADQWDYFELLSIKSTQAQENRPEAPPPASPDEDTYEVTYRKLGPDEEIKPEMFRVAISMKRQDNLEYIVAPGEYRKSFPYYGSVAGMALALRRTIVMDRDKYRKFRSQSFVEGKTPSEVAQLRGLDRIDFLSYIVIPMATNFGKPEEAELGVIHVDTKLFARPRGQVETEFSTVRRDRNELDKFAAYANNLYDQEDKNIEYLEKLRAVIVPLLELYNKCRTGAA